jgi:glutathione S-transferase
MQLWYWPGIQGRGEFVRLALEAAGMLYDDKARQVGEEGLMADMEARGPAGPFAPPYIDTGKQVIAQVANILLYLGDTHDMAPPKQRYWLHQLQLTIADLVAEVHNVHHPIDGMAYYEDQKPEALRYAEQFRANRIPKFLAHFEAAATAHPGDWLTGKRWSYGDTSLFQVVEGLRYMFPKRMAALKGDYPALTLLHARVAALPGIAAYLKSDRRLAFNTQGIFRYYPELDAA